MSACAKCGAEFQCGMADAAADQACWCTKLPALPAGAIESDAGRCLCPACLQDWIDTLAQKQPQGD
jgi:hypothetical protein